MNPDMLGCAYWNRGALNLAIPMGGRMAAKHQFWEELMHHLPLIDMDVAAQGEPSSMWRDYISNARAKGFWDRISIRDFDQIDVPIYLMSGWYDYYTDAAARRFRTLGNARKPRDVRLVVDRSNHVRKIRGD